MTFLLHSSSPDSQKSVLPSEENVPDSTSQSSQGEDEQAADEAPNNGVSVRDAASSFNGTAGSANSTVNGETANENQYKSSYQTNANDIQVSHACFLCHNHHHLHHHHHLVFPISPPKGA